MLPQPGEFLDYAPPPRRRHTSGALLGLALAATFGGQAVAQFLLYRERALGRWGVAASDLVVFGVPAVLAITAYAFAFLAATRGITSAPRRAVAVGSLSLAAWLFSTWVSLLIPFNLFGT